MFGTGRPASLAADDEISHSFSGMGSLDAIGQQFATLAQQAGMACFVVTRFPHGDQPEFSSNFVMGNWPAELQEAYAASDAFGFSRVIARLKETIVPFFSTAPVFLGEGNGRDDKDLAGLFARSDLVSHLAFSIHDAALQHYVVAFSGNVATLARDKIAALHLGSVELVDISSRSARQPAGAHERLSARELECLRWTAAGKSSEEIGIILNISSHTVVSYLKSAMRKLDSVNRMQAIARACRLRLL